MDEKQQVDTPPALPAALGCVELWAGNDLIHRQVKLAGLEADVFSQPSGAPEGGDLFALFSCAGAREARIVLADCTGHGHEASLVAARVHGLIHRYRDIPDNSHLLGALNEEFAVPGRELQGPLRLSTAVLATFDRQTGEFNFAYAAHPRILLWRARYRRWVPLDGSAGLPVGAFAGSIYAHQSIRLEPADIALMFSDGATDAFSPDDEMLTAEGLLELADVTLARFSARFDLHFFVEALAEAVQNFHGKNHLEDDLTLLALRRSQF